jgi:putative RNA 2'-phosphotransferase
MDKTLVRASKLLSLVLRHEPQHIGITLDSAGWVAVDELLAAVNQAGIPLTRALLQRVVDENDKQRFRFSDDGLRIRASQGHSVEVELALPPKTPPELLYHGTATRFLDSIRQQGLLAQSRQQVHLSADHDTAVNVGQRHGKPVVLTVKSGAMHSTGHLFYQADNGVWLTDHVPPVYLVIPNAV